MSKQFDELAKSLAKGTSRRSAIRMFLTGIGAAVAGVFLGRGTALAGGKGSKNGGGKSSKQSHGDKCRDHCQQHYGSHGDKFDKCCEESDNCSDDCCAILIGINQTEDISICTPVAT